MKHCQARSIPRPPWILLSMAILAFCLLHTRAAHAADITLSWSSNATTNTVNINNALSNPSYTRVILAYSASPWTVNATLRMRTAGQELWIQGNGSSSGKIDTAVGSFTGTSAPLIRVEANGCTINGYNNGVDKTDGVAVLEMRKADYIADPTTYPFSEGRHGIRIWGFDNSTVKGVTIKNTGGDGIYLNTVYNTTATDVVVDGAYRNGMSVISADTLTIRSSIFKNTRGTAPEAGIDFEPNGSTDRLVGINVYDSTFSYNNGSNIQIGIGNLTGAGVYNTLSIRFYRCTSDHAGRRGLHISGMKSDGPSLGMVYFQDFTISYSTNSCIYIGNWVADRVQIIFNDITLTHCGDASTSQPVIVEDNSPIAESVGEVLFQGECYIDDYNSAHTSLVRGSQYTSSTVFKDIRGNIYWRRAYASNAPIIFWPTTTSGVTLTATPY